MSFKVFGIIRHLQPLLIIFVGIQSTWIGAIKPKPLDSNKKFKPEHPTYHRSIIDPIPHLLTANLYTILFWLKCMRKFTYVYDN